MGISFNYFILALYVLLLSLSKCDHAGFAKCNSIHVWYLFTMNYITCLLYIRLFSAMQVLFQSLMNYAFGLFSGQCDTSRPINVFSDTYSCY